MLVSEKVRILGGIVKEGQLFMISAPSGAGKTSLVRQLVQRVNGLQVSVSHTTRERRKGEIDGEDYYFVDRKQFEKMIDSDDFLEYASVFENYYGTSKSAVDKTLSEGIDVLLEIDWQGAVQIKKNQPQTCAIFILPPSREALIERLKSRGKDSDEVIARRTAEAVREMKQFEAADYLIINDKFDVALDQLISLVTVYRLKLKRQYAKHFNFIESLLQ